LWKLLIDKRHQGRGYGAAVAGARSYGIGLARARRPMPGLALEREQPTRGQRRGSASPTIDARLAVLYVPEPGAC
jgi:hypothetical protein